MARLLALLIFSTALAWPADWVYFRSGPIEVWSNSGDAPARKALAVLDQEKWFVEKTLGKSEMKPLWPVRIVMTKDGQASAGVKLVRDAYAASLNAKQGLTPAIKSDFVRILIRDDAKTLPAFAENGLVALLSTIEADGVHVELGRPPAEKTRDWVRAHLLALEPAYGVKSRVFYFNLQQGALLDEAYRSAFQKTEKEMETEVDRYFKAGSFASQQVGGKPLEPGRDYRERAGTLQAAKLYLADANRGGREAYLELLNAGDKSAGVLEGAEMFAEAVQTGSLSAPAWVNYASALKDSESARGALRKAMELNPRWAEPHARWAELEPDPGRAAIVYKKAAELDPRNTAYWIALAHVQMQAKDYKGASESWRAGEKWAADDQKRAQIATRREAYEKERIELEEAGRRREADEKARELEALKQKALANIRAAENKANAQAPPPNPEAKVVEWWDGPAPASKLQGVLERIECGRGPSRWIVRDAEGKLQTFLALQPDKIAILGGGEAAVECGPQKPARRVKLEAGPKNEVLTVEFLP